MTTKPLEELPFNNLKFLNDKEDFLANRYTLKKHQFIKEDNDTLYSLSDLEYPLFFTFHQLINHVHTTRIVNCLTENLSVIVVDCLTVTCVLKYQNNIVVILKMCYLYVMPKKM